MEILLVHKPVVSWWIVFGEVATLVLTITFPVDGKLVVGNAVHDLMVVYVEGFIVFHTHLGSKNGVGSQVASFNEGVGGRLGMSSFVDGSDNGTGFLGIKENTISFCFGREGRNTEESFDCDLERSIGVKTGRVLVGILMRVKRVAQRLQELKRTWKAASDTRIRIILLA